MGISKYNAEGYFDPTAYEGIRNAEADARKLKIIYPTGSMELNLDYFFPCTLDKARKVFLLINEYSSYADKTRLLTFLQKLENKYVAQMHEYADKAKSYQMNSPKFREYTAMFKEARRLRQRTERNIELLSEGRKER